MPLRTYDTEVPGSNPTSSEQQVTFSGPAGAGDAIERALVLVLTCDPLEKKRGSLALEMSLCLKYFQWCKLPYIEQTVHFNVAAYNKEKKIF